MQILLHVVFYLFLSYLTPIFSNSIGRNTSTLNEIHRTRSKKSGGGYHIYKSFTRKDHCFVIKKKLKNELKGLVWGYIYKNKNEDERKGKKKRK